MSVDFSPDGRQVLTGDIRYGLRLWDVDSGKQLKALEGHTNWVRTVAFSLDFTEDIKREPNKGSHYLHRGYCLQHLGREQVAAADFEMVKKLGETK